MTDNLVEHVNLDELEGKYGILLRHIKQIQRYNNRLNWLIMLRPINKDVAGKLHAGSRGKIISIKGKSSEFIFLAGDIPFEAGLSKLGSKGEGSDWGKIEHFNSVNRNSINEKDKEEKKNLEEKIKNLKNDISDLESVRQELEQKEEDYTKIKQELQKKQKEPTEGQQKLEQVQKELTEAQQELQQKQLGIQKKQKELKHLTLYYNLHFNLNTIPKIVDIDGVKYESFYELDENGHPKYEKINYKEEQKDGSFVVKERSEPIIYVREVGKITDGYAKIKYDDSEIGYSIDTDTETQKEAGNQNIKTIEIFSYEQYEECAISGDKKIRIDNTYGEECEIEGYCTFNDKSGNFYVKAKKEKDNEFKYYLLENPTNLAGQEGIETYEINLSKQYNGTEKAKYLETNYELIKPPLTADYDQLSAARVYNGREQINNITNLESAIEYVKQEQNKLISLPPNKYMEECKKAAIRLSTGEYISMDDDINNVKTFNSILGISNISSNETIISKCKELVENKSFNNLNEYQVNTIKRLSTAPYSKYNDDINKLSEISEEIAKATDYNTIAQESDILQLKLGLLGCCGESVTKEKLELGEILGYGISHGLEMLHYPPESIRSSILDELLGNENNKDEEFLVVDGEGNPRIAKNLEGVLFFMNNQRNSGLCCLEPNPLWPIKVNFNESPHIIEVDDMMDSPLLTGGFYTGAVELQKKLGTPSFTDEFIYAERLFLNSDFVPNIKLPNDVRIEDIRREIEIENLRRANKHYEKVITNLEFLRRKANQNYSRNFMEFCQQQNLSEYIETKDEIIDIFKNKNEVKTYFSAQNNIENLKGFTNQIIEAYKEPNGSLYKIINNPEILDKRKKIGEHIKNNILTNISSNTIKDDIVKVLMDEKIRTMLLSEPDNPALKAKFFDTLPNINLLKGFEIKQKADFMQMDFMEHLDDYIGFVKERQLQTMDRLKAMGQSIDEPKLSELIEDIKQLKKDQSERLDKNIFDLIKKLNGYQLEIYSQNTYNNVDNELKIKQIEKQLSYLLRKHNNVKNQQNNIKITGSPAEIANLVKNFAFYQNIIIEQINSEKNKLKLSELKSKLQMTEEYSKYIKENVEHAKEEADIKAGEYRNDNQKNSEFKYNINLQVHSGKKQGNQKDLYINTDYIAAKNKETIKEFNENKDEKKKQMELSKDANILKETKALIECLSEKKEQILNPKQNNQNNQPKPSISTRQALPSLKMNKKNNFNFIFNNLESILSENEKNVEKRKPWETIILKSEMKPVPEGINNRANSMLNAAIVIPKAKKQVKQPWRR